MEKSHQELNAEQMFGTDHADSYPELAREALIGDSFREQYDLKQYISTLPDLQNGPESLIKGSKVEIQHVGISNFVVPIQFMQRDRDEPIKLETSITGSVSLEAQKKGINMSRIMRTFYEYNDELFSINLIEKVLNSYTDKLESESARIQMKFRFPMVIESLRSGLSGYQYYDVALEVLKSKTNEIKKIIHLDYVYSSTCPCSTELSEHSRKYRSVMATPHSQRSVARVSLVMDDFVYIEDVIEAMRSAVPTETQVMVKREDEQAFAELNGANTIFVEDAVRLFFKSIQAMSQVGDFRIIASHQESLHSHDAVSILVSGETFAQESYDPNTFKTLFHVG